MSEARQEILDRLKNAVHSMPENPGSDTTVYLPITQPLAVEFKENLEKVSGDVHLFSSEKELYGELKNLLSKYNSYNVYCAEEAIKTKLRTFRIPFSGAAKLPTTIEVGITGCEFLVAHTGSAMVSSAQKGGRQLFVYPPVHIIIASKNQLVDYLDTAYLAIQEKYKNNLPSQITLITGQSRTADIEKTLILGAHGPKELHVFIA